MNGGYPFSKEVVLWCQNQQSHSKKGDAKVSVTTALQLMLAFGTFVLILLVLVIELIKLSQKNNHHKL
ncbi:putative holin-like toxin [Fructobacillus evanidus]|uniref:putative holin-like toxin n=1 Tax=Fructobacillus evanidus TaxID=3064281 RepID=UPI003BAD1CF5